MERNVRYVWIGAIFFVVLIFMVAFILWLNRFEMDSAKYAQYYAYSSNEIEGIGTNTPIRYKGISIGHVRDVKFKDIKEGTIEITMLIESILPIRKNAKVIISSQGLAGANYLSLIHNDDGEILEANDEGKKVIMLERGGFDKIIAKASELGDSVDMLLRNVNALFDVQSLSEIHFILREIHETTTHMKSISEQLDRQMKNGEYNVREILTPTLFQLQGSLQDMSGFFTRASAFLDKVDKNPYDSLFGQESKDSKNAKDK
ncbi:MAG: MCE family protein [Helicobacter sp.]|uniref:MlaD family protein n=1 Tax=Helicobacter sp. TaxID=218 RepID=UPI0025C7333D|nr:MlaD family protein [Helicobacter sp.]MCH5313567.1 MCE family protein [Helicobacter sp.]